MKIFFSIIGLVFATVGLAAVVNTNEFVELSFDNTKICVPKEYVPGLSPFGQWLQKNVSGLDDSGQSEIIRLPAKVIMAGVPGYQFSHINKYNVDLEHKVSGVAHNLSNVGNPYGKSPCDDENDLGYCYQSVVYKDVFYQYTLKTVEVKNKEKVSKYLVTLFEQWNNNCTGHG
ncbi:hypothetical protein A3759_17050 [Thalassolituus sp. HI0120]|nr:hypothetical protein A3759_17050 [Thalassolituus sp. HI0120]